MQLKDLWDEYNSRFYNLPIQFEDIISSDGVRNSYSLSYSPLSNIDPYKPQVVDKSGASPIELVENVDYTIDYELGVLRFIKIPKERAEGVVVNAFYQKTNLKEFCDDYNSAVRLMQANFPLKKMFKIEWQEGMRTKKDDSIQSFFLSDEWYKDIDRVYEIYQNTEDKYKIPYTQRDKQIVFTSDHISKNPIGSGPGDYGYSIGSDLVGVKYPFYIYGEKKYEEIKFSNSVLETHIEFDSDARNQIVLLLGRKLYERWFHKSTPLALTVLNIQDKQSIMQVAQSLDMQLWADLRANYSFKVFPNNEKKIYE